MLIALLVAVGLLPFLLGGLLNWYIMTYTESLPPLFLIGVLFLVFWGVVAFFAFRALGSVAKVVIPLNAVGFIVLFLVWIQEIVLHGYWQNAVGLWTQYYYLPLLQLGDFLPTLIFRGSHLFFDAYAPAFLLMLAVSFAGCKIGKRYV